MKRLGFDLILLGAPAAGKDTQASLLMKKYSMKPVESGKYWRKLLKSKTKDGAWVRRTSGLGHAAPTPLMKKFLLKQVKSLPKNKDLIFIGNPRLKPEAQLLFKLLTGKKHDFLVIYINLPAKEIYSRSMRRVRTRRENQTSYIDNRIKYHKLQVSKTVEYFKSKRRLKFINGSQSIKKVGADIQKAINDYQRSRAN